MFLKHREWMAFLLLLTAAVSWSFGLGAVREDGPYHIEATEHMDTADTSTPDTAWTASGSAVDRGVIGEDRPETTNTPAREPEPETKGESLEIGRVIGFVLCFAAAGTAFGGIFLLRQKRPLFGPDGVFFLFALAALMLTVTAPHFYALEQRWDRLWSTHAVRIPAGLALLWAARELWGWARARFSLAWCLAARMAGRMGRPARVLLLYTGWIVLPLVGAGWQAFWWARTRWIYGISVFGHWLLAVMGFLTAGALCLICLWRYGKGLEHLAGQLDSFQQGKPVTVGEGAFSRTEEQLLALQARHEEAVRTAVTSERFKVELIANVSHDLRTPLTSILGYSELLQKETLSPEGREQLRRLHQKAGYMNDLVESLFELTKVSSGAQEMKREEIDLVRLIEQTVGLFDDQITAAGLTVKRSYGADALPVVTDGARMHQVFANLLGNAVKYALKGTRIFIDVREGESVYTVRMVNTASYEMDFTPEEIVQRFARGDRARSTKGSGLGLAIAQTYTESVGGSFRVAVDGDQFNAVVELPKIVEPPKTERDL